MRYFANAYIIDKNKPNNIVMYSISQLREIIQNEIKKANYIEEPMSLFEPIKYIMQDGGKRLRPVLLLMAYNLYRDDIERAYKSAIGIEMFHNYTLLHDDVMDNADLRRGRQTVHKKWNQNVAILSGDAAAITSYIYIESVDDIYLRRVIEGFNQVAMDVCKGQQYDMEFETRSCVSEEEYIYMIFQKTSVLIAGSIRHGALIAGAPECEYNALYDFGGALGLAFQLQDDYLDVYGDSVEFGKEIGGDIINNKKTYLLIKALELSTPENKQLLEDWVNKKEFDKNEKIAEVTKLYDKAGIKDVVNAKINEYLKQSEQILDGLQVDNERKQAFYKIINHLKNRKS